MKRSSLRLPMNPLPKSFPALALVFILLLSLFPATVLGAAAPWSPNTAYKTGDLVSYSGKTYACIQPHTSLTGWEPPNVPALWKLSADDPVDTTPPTAPTNLRASSIGITEVALAWNPATDNVDVVSYEVYKGPQLAGTTNTTSYTAKGLTPDTAYSFSVKALDAAGNRSEESNSLSVRTNMAPVDTEPPTAPTGLQLLSATPTSLTLSWNASTDNIGVAGYDILLNGTNAASTSNTTHTLTGLTAATSYTILVRAYDAAGNRSADSNILTAETPQVPIGSGSKQLIGYWHNFDNGSTNIRLKDISPRYDIIQVAFAEPIGDRATMAFTPYNATKEQFKADIALLQSQGKKVLISIGGANGTVELTSTTARDSFVRSMNDLIQEYGFNGIDIDLEGSSLALTGADTDFKNPTTPKIINLISAIRTILQGKPSDFMLTMAPETAYVQGGMVAYGGPWGAYLPVIYAFKDRLNILHVQHYNTGSITALDGRSYSQGTADFQVAMAEMLLQGFPVNGNASNRFPALREDQIAIGLPAAPAAAGGGYTSPANIDKALQYLVKGTSYGGTYQLIKSSGYRNFRGVMTWSINWDQASGNNFSQPVRTTLNGLQQ